MELNKRAIKLWNKHNSVTDQKSQGGQTALKEHLAVLHSETASTTQQPRGEYRGTINKDCKIAGATMWQGQGNHTFTTTWLEYLLLAPLFSHVKHFLNSYFWVISGKFLQVKYQKCKFIGEESKAKCAKTWNWKLVQNFKSCQYQHLKAILLCVLDSL